MHENRAVSEAHINGYMYALPGMQRVCRRIHLPGEEKNRKVKPTLFCFKQPSDIYEI